MKGFKNYLKKFGKMVLIDLGIVLAFFIAAGIFFFATNFAYAESFTTLSDLPGLAAGSEAPTLGAFVNVLFQMAIGLGAIIAVLMIVIGGFQYLSTDLFQMKGEARERITNSLLGLGLLLVSTLLLQTINPKLLDLNVNLMDAGTDVDSAVYIDTGNVAAVIADHEAQMTQALRDGYTRTQFCRDEGWTPGPARQQQIDWITREYQECEASRARAAREGGAQFTDRCLISYGEEDVTTVTPGDGGIGYASTYTSGVYRICAYSKPN